MILKRHIPDGDQDYTAGAIVNIDLPRENFYRRLFLWVVLDGNSATNVTTSACSYMFQRINVMADNQVIKSYQGDELAGINCIDYGASLTSMGLDQVVDKDSGDELCLAIDFGLSPTDYRHMIASAELSSFQLQITWAPIAAMDSNGTPTFDGNLKVHTDEVVADDIDPAKLGIIQERSVRKLPPGTANTWTTIDLPLGNIYRRIIGWTWSADLYKLHDLHVGTDLFEVLHNGNVMMQSGYVDAFELEDHLDARKMDISREGQTAGTEYAFYERPLIIDFDKDRANLDEVIDTARSSSLQFKVREDGTNDGAEDSIALITQEIIP